MEDSHVKKNSKTKVLPIIIIGGGGHASVLYEALKLQGDSVIAIADPKPGEWTLHLPEIQILHSDDEVFKHAPSSCRLANAIGSTHSLENRQLIFEKFTKKGYSFTSVIHPTAVISSHTHFADGVQIMAGAVIQPGVKIGVNTIINTGARVDHDCVVGDHVHIATGAILSGSVHVAQGTHIGTGAVIIQSIKIGEAALVAAGAVVIHDVAAKTTVAGVPAREM